MPAKLVFTTAVTALCVLAASWSADLGAQFRPLAALDGLEAGEWEVRVRDEPGAPQRLCLRDARKLIQLRHPGQPCNRIVVEDTPQQVTIQYTCRGRGYGRTQIRRETESLVQIDSQGIAQSLPFSFSAEARRVGTCHSGVRERRAERSSSREKRP